jgi:Uma2 family endonuclease
MATDPMRIRVAEDVLRLPLPPGVSGYELVDGVPVPVTPVGPTHGHLAVVLASQLQKHVTEQSLGGRVYVEAGYVLALQRDPQRLRGPDVSFVCQAKLQDTPDPERGFSRQVPDLVVEIDSPHSGQLKQRIQDFLDAGTPLAWVIRPAKQTATVHHADGSVQQLEHDGVLDGEDVLPGFRLSLNELFSS